MIDHLARLGGLLWICSSFESCEGVVSSAPIKHRTVWEACRNAFPTNHETWRILTLHKTRYATHSVPVRTPLSEFMLAYISAALKAFVPQSLTHTRIASSTCSVTRCKQCLQSNQYRQQHAADRIPEVAPEGAGGAEADHVRMHHRLQELYRVDLRIRRKTRTRGTVTKRNEKRD